MTTKLTLIGFPTCPFLQRAIITLNEKAVAFDVVYVDANNKPEWFSALSPLGKTPVLKVERVGHEPTAIFESAVIVEYLEETAKGPRLHPEDPLMRAQHRSWIEFCSQLLGDFWRMNGAESVSGLDAARRSIRTKLERLELIVVGPYFSGEQFSLVDAAFAPAFRQLDALESVIDTGLTSGLPRVSQWRKALSSRTSVKDAVAANYVDLYLKPLHENNALILGTPTENIPTILEA